MANFNPVKPGDLITADYFNQVLGSFDVRISKLEAASGISSGQMVITGLSPSGPLHMGDQLTVLGQNFGLPSQVVVTLDGASLSGSSFLPGSGNNALVFQIPAVQGVPAQGRLVTLTVSNAISAAQTTFVLFPFQVTIPTGNLVVNLTGSPAVGTIGANNSYLFVFTVAGFTSLTDNYTVTPSLDSASQAAGWTAIPVDPNTPDPHKPLTQVTIPQGQNTKTQIGVLVAIPLAAGVASAQLTLTLTSLLNSSLFGTGNITITINAAPPPPNKIGLSVTFVQSPGSFGPNGITVPASTASASTTSTVVVSAVIPSDVPEVDAYTTADPTFSNTSWVGTVATKKHFSVGGPATVQIAFQVTPKVGAPQANLVVGVTSDVRNDVSGNVTIPIQVG